VLQQSVGGKVDHPILAEYVARISARPTWSDDDLSNLTFVLPCFVLPSVTMMGRFANRAGLERQLSGLILNLPNSDLSKLGFNRPIDLPGGISPR
jgi:hypothetical protein